MDKEQIESRIDEFLSFYKDVNDKFSIKLADENEISTIKQITDTVNEANEECTLPEQIRLNKRIAILLMMLGTLASKRTKQANVVFRYVRWRKHCEWSPAKKNLESSMQKVLVGDIEHEVAKKIFAEEIIESNIQGFADWLITLHRDVTSFKSALQRQIDFNMKEYGQSQPTTE